VKKETAVRETGYYFGNEYNSEKLFRISIIGEFV